MASLDATRGRPPLAPAPVPVGTCLARGSAGGARRYRSRSMLAQAISATVLGVDAVEVRVEVFLTNGLPSFTVVGLPGTAVQESRERVRAALKNMGEGLPPSRIVVNLAPADVRKEGPSFDLPIALALLAAQRRLPAAALARMLSFGELALDGSLRPVRGAVNIGLLAAEHGYACVLAPPDDAAQVAAVGDLEVLGPRTLLEAVEVLRGRRKLERYVPGPEAPAPPAPDMADVRGQLVARRALEVAAAGGHNILFTGSPGSGKTMLALRLPGLLPALDDTAALEVTRVYSSAGLLRGRGLMRRPPFRNPHHSGSEAGLIGGGSVPRPGEVSLAHRGVLFLDELPEFRRPALESLRQPLETGSVTIARASRAITFPAAFQLVAARNPCACGHQGDPREACVCTPNERRRYTARVSGPLLDRIDMRLTLPRLSPQELLGRRVGEATAVVAQRVAAARARMLERQGCLNSAPRGPKAGPAMRLTPAARSLAPELITSLRLSGRGFERLLRVSRTIADLAGEGMVDEGHLAEAAAYRGVPAWEA